MMDKRKYFVLNKPYGVLSQFTGEANDQLLGDLFNFPKDVYSVGRLDKDSEGLLLLTNDNQLKTKLLEPRFNHSKTYWVQIEGQISENEVAKLKKGGLELKNKGKTYFTKPSECKIIEPIIEDRIPPIRERKSIPTSWIELTIYEGKNRQVRKMTAAVGFPTLRLIRVGIDTLKLNELSLVIGATRELSISELPSSWMRK